MLKVGKKVDNEVILDYDYQEFVRTLKYIHTGEFIFSKPDYSKLHPIITDLKLKQLINYCSDELTKDLTPDECIKILLNPSDILINKEKLLYNSKKVLIENYNKASKHQNFFKLDESTLIDIYSSDLIFQGYLNFPEDGIFEGIISYAKAITGSDNVSSEDVQKVILRFKVCIRNELLSKGFVLKTVKLLNLVYSEKEYTGICEHLLLKKDIHRRDPTSLE